MVTVQMRENVVARFVCLLGYSKILNNTDISMTGDSNSTKQKYFICDSLVNLHEEIVLIEFLEQRWLHLPVIQLSKYNKSCFKNIYDVIWLK